MAAQRYTLVVQIRCNCVSLHMHMEKAPQNYLSINWVLDCVSFYVTKGLWSREAATGHASKNNNL